MDMKAKAYPYKRCSDCPMRKRETDHGSSWPYCGAPDSPKFPDNVISTHLVMDLSRGYLEDDVAFPEWCPLPVTIKRAK